MAKKTIKTVFLLTPRMLATSLTWPTEMLLAANQRNRNKINFELMTCAVEKTTIPCHSHITLQAQYTIDDIQQADIIFLPALWRNPTPILQSQRKLYSWLQMHYENGAIICGVGTGCCFMAEAGLLNNKPATTHWHYFDYFQKSYPQVQLKRQHFITQAGQLFCTASINSLADLTVYFIQRFMHREVSQHIQRHFSHEIRQAYDQTSYFENDNLNHSDEDILQVQLWLQNHLGKRIVLKAVATDFGMSHRNFSRRFKQATGQTATYYLQNLRLKTAKDLLQSSNLSINEIADKVGYSDASYFAQLFKQRFSVSPADYRTTVRAKLFHIEPSKEL